MRRLREMRQLGADVRPVEVRSARPLPLPPLCIHLFGLPSCRPHRSPVLPRAVLQGLALATSRIGRVGRMAGRMDRTHVDCPRQYMGLRMVVGMVGGWLRAGGIARGLPVWGLGLQDGAMVGL